MRTRTLLERSAVVAFLISLTLLVLVPASPLFQKLPSWDSGVFLYTGWRITLGELPYRDIWDHKPPLIFVLNALGVLLGNGSRWGVWAIEFVFLFAAALLGFNLIRRAFGALAAVYATVAWMVNAFVTMDGGNYTTEYALPLQFGLLWLIATAPDSAISVRRAFVLGILSGLLFWLKQNDIGIPFAIVVFLTLDFLRERRSEKLRALAVMSGGALLVSALVVLPFLVQGALAQFWEAAFLYNFDYIDETWLDRVLTLRFLPVTLPALGLTTFAFTGWLIGALAFLSSIRERWAAWTNWSDTLDRLWGARTDIGRRPLTHAQIMRLMSLVVIALPVECFFVVLSGNRFDHYFLALLPVLSVLAAFTFRILLIMLERAALAYWVRVAFAGALLGVLIALSTDHMLPIYHRIVSRQNTALIAFILANTRASDTVVVWGGEARINFETKRANPTRFVYFSPLRQNAPNGLVNTREMVSSLMAHPPRLLVDPTANTGRVLKFAAADAEIERDAQALLARYEIIQTNDVWTAYEYRVP